MREAKCSKNIWAKVDKKKELKIVFGTGSIAIIKNVKNARSDQTFLNEFRFQGSPTINFAPNTSIYSLKHCYYLIKEERFLLM